MKINDLAIDILGTIAYFFIRFLFFLILGGVIVAPTLLLTAVLAAVSWVRFVNEKRHNAEKTKQIKWIILAVVGTVLSVVLIIISIFLWNEADFLKW